MRRGLVIFVLALGWPAAASAQLSFDVIGTRALGMGGAFVAVANDPTAFHWNPAGLIHGEPVGMTVGWDRLHFGNPELPAALGASRNSSRITAVGSWPLGVSYGHFHSARVVGFGPTGEPVVEALRVQHIGVTVVQTLLEGVVAGATVKYVRGRASTGETASFLAGEALDQAMDRGGDSDGALDLDIGVMGEFGPVRVGYTMKNVLQPTFVGIAGFSTQLKRRQRLGLAVLPTDGVTLAFDMDLDTADPLVGLRRVFAAGGEFRLGRSAAVRGGVRWSRDGDPQPIGAVGASLKIRQGYWIDGYATYSRAFDRGFGVAFRAGS
jgi:hypothetical protein